MWDKDGSGQGDGEIKILFCQCTTYSGDAPDCGARKTYDTKHQVIMTYKINYKLWLLYAYTIITALSTKTIP